MVGFLLITIGLFFLNIGYSWGIYVERSEDPIAGTSVFGGCLLPIGIILFISGFYAIIKYIIDTIKIPKVSISQVKFEMLIFGIIIILIFIKNFIDQSFKIWDIFLYGEQLLLYDNYEVMMHKIALGIFAFPIIVGIVAIGFYLKKILRVLVPVVLIIFLLIVPTYYAYQANIINKVTEKCDYEYELTIYIEGTGNYSLYVPLPLDQNEQPFTDVINYLRNLQNNNNYFEVIETYFGPTLKILGSKNSTITVSGTNFFNTTDLNHYTRNSENNNPKFKLNLSLEVNNSVNSKKEKYWVYCSKDQNITKLRLQVKLRLDYKFECYSQDGKRKCGLFHHNVYNTGGWYLNNNEWQQIPKTD